MNIFSQAWNLILYQPLLNSLVFLYKLTGDLGWSIILLTLVLRFIMTPLIVPSLKITKKVQELGPEINKLKEQYKNDKQGLITAQAELYKKHGANPASGCLPQIIQLLVLIALYSVFNLILKVDGKTAAQKLNPQLYSINRISTNYKISSSFLYLNLTKPDTFKLPGTSLPLPGLFLLLAALTQFLSSKMMSPVISAEKKIADKSETSTDDAMVEAQQQMLIMFPLMTLLIGYKFPSGLVVYWFIFSFLSMIQQYLVSGWGGLTPWLKKANLVKSHTNGLS
jgi:YidC/Oxa1 family membrane protein insertase